jgi:hypothetical protein
MTSQNLTKNSFVVLIICLVTFSHALVQASPRSESMQAAGNSASELQALRNEVALLRKQVQLLSEKGGTGQPESKQGNERGPGSVAGDAQIEQDPDADAEAARLSKRIGAINKQFESEDVDAKWAYVAEYRVRQLLEDTVVSRVPDISFTCRTTLCRLEVKSDKDVQLSVLERDLVTKLSREFPRGLAHRENTDSDMSSLVVYLAREGQRLPKPGK